MSENKKNKSKLQQFPNIYRFITEKIEGSSSQIKNLGLGFLFGAVFTLIVLVSFDLLSNFRIKTATDNQISSLRSQIGYWEEVVEKQKGYRDGYFMLSVLEYQLSDFKKSREYLKKALLIDPNFTVGQDLEEILDREM